MKIQSGVSKLILAMLLTVNLGAYAQESSTPVSLNDEQIAQANEVISGEETLLEVETKALEEIQAKMDSATRVRGYHVIEGVGGLLTAGGSIVATPFAVKYIEKKALTEALRRKDQSAFQSATNALKAHESLLAKLPASLTVEELIAQGYIDDATQTAYKRELSKLNKTLDRAVLSRIARMSKLPGFASLEKSIGRNAAILKYTQGIPVDVLIQKHKAGEIDQQTMNLIRESVMPNSTVNAKEAASKVAREVEEELFLSLNHSRDTQPVFKRAYYKAAFEYSEKKMPKVLSELRKGVRGYKAAAVAVLGASAIVGAYLVHDGGNAIVLDNEGIDKLQVELDEAKAKVAAAQESAQAYRDSLNQAAAEAN